MPHISVHYKMYIPGGHHRQPRNTSAELELAPSGEFDITNPGNATPNYFAQLPYTLGGGSGIAGLVFWSITDGTNGKVYGASPLTQPVGANPLTITAWYWPITGPGVGNGGGSAILDDAFSANLGRFIDDTFVIVTNNPALTPNANIIGIVPTNVAQVLVAAHSVASTTEPFAQWICADAGTAAGDTVNVPAGANGVAIAVYQRSDVILNLPREYEIGGIIIGGVRVDGGGAIIINGVPHPIDPWGPLMLRLVRSGLIAAAATSLDKQVAAQIGHLAAQDAMQAIKQGMQALEQYGKKK
jgi:hypothetical protein